MFLILTYYFVYLCVRSASGWLLVLLIKQNLNKLKTKMYYFLKLIYIDIVILELVWNMVRQDLPMKTLWSQFKTSQNHCLGQIVHKVRSRCRQMYRLNKNKKVWCLKQLKTKFGKYWFQTIINYCFFAPVITLSDLII